MQVFIGYVLHQKPQTVEPERWIQAEKIVGFKTHLKSVDEHIMNAGSLGAVQSGSQVIERVAGHVVCALLPHVPRTLGIHAPCPLSLCTLCSHELENLSDCIQEGRGTQKNSDNTTEMIL